MKAFGSYWAIGEPWGVAHPDHACYSDDSQVHYADGVLQLGIGLRPAEHHGRQYLWAIGKVHSLQRVKYGIITATFRLPLGRNLWPAIWLYDTEAWPPEIDILEGWTAQGFWPLLHRSDYLRLPWCHNIHPGLVHPAGLGGAYGSCGNKAVWRCQLNVHDLNRCRLTWTPDKIEVAYNGHTVMRETRPDVLKAYNESNGMTIVLNNYVTRAFSYDDYNSLAQRTFTITDFSYTPYCYFYN